MADIDNHLRPQHDLDDCLSSCIHGILSHLAEERSELIPDLENISYKQVNQTITPNNGLEPAPYTPPHVENYDDYLNQRLFNDTSVWIINTLHNSIDDLIEVLEDPDKSLPAVSLHSDYFKWQEMTNDNKAHYRHAVVVKDVTEDKVIIRDPLSNRYDHISFNLEIPRTQFKEVWNKVNDDNFEENQVPNELIYLEIRDTEPGQTRLQYGN